MARVFVAMSGGVDSSVAAALLLEQGHDVTGVTLQLWPSGDDAGACCSVPAVRDARRVCDLLGINHYTLNFRERFERDVVAPFARAYSQGRTPNPCIDCNDQVKFSELLRAVALQGADLLATGHYARIVSASTGARRLARGIDASKDQSYFLYRLSERQMEHVVFPVGELHKSDVRAIAQRMGLAVAEKPDSQEICFAADGDYCAVVASRQPEAFESGPIVDLEGRALARHEGIAHYTVGQRKGIGVGGLGAPLYVVRIDAATRSVVVGPREALAVTRLTAEQVVWHGEPTQQVDAAVRYRMAPRPATAVLNGAGGLDVAFRDPLEGVAPGQSVVCYVQDVVVGGGVVTCAS